MPPELTGARVAEAHFFFEPGSIGQPLYARTHTPADPFDIGVVVVPPIGRERIRIYREMANFGHDLAEARFPVLRFDYRGEGDSSGEFRNSTVTSRVADTVAASNELRRRSGARRVALVGFHLGGVVAALAATEAGADFLVLCDPVSATQAYVKNLLRANIFQQTQYFGHATALEPDLRTTLRAGNLVSIYGFQAAGALIDELEAIDPTVALKKFSGESAILYFVQKQGAPPERVETWCALLGGPSRCTVSAVVMNFSWTTRKRWTPKLVPLNNATVSWLQGRATGRVGQPSVV